MSGEQAFSFSQSTLEMTGAKVEAEARAGVGAKVGARASKTALRILCKSSSEYLGILVVVTGASAIEGFVSKGPVRWLDISSPDSEGREESSGATEGVMEGVMEGHSRRRCLRP